MRYCFEIANKLSPYLWFAYFDTSDRQARFLFDYEKADVTIEGEFGSVEDPYRIFLCRVPRDQRDRFLTAVNRIPAVMDYAGRSDYDGYCRRVLLDARHFLARKNVMEPALAS
jgi:hypothetical protein